MKPVPPLPDTVDTQLAAFVMSMLAKDPLDRPPDAMMVSKTLARIERSLLDQQTHDTELILRAEPTVTQTSSQRAARRAQYATSGMAGFA
jgi:hypothetical protein